MWQNKWLETKWALLKVRFSANLLNSNTVFKLNESPSTWFDILFFVLVEKTLFLSFKICWLTQKEPKIFIPCSFLVEILYKFISFHLISASCYIGKYLRAKPNSNNSIYDIDSDGGFDRFSFRKNMFLIIFLLYCNYVHLTVQTFKCITFPLKLFSHQFDIKIFKPSTWHSIPLTLQVPSKDVQSE